MFLSSSDAQLDNNNTITESTNKFNFNNIGYVNHRQPRNPSWRTSNYAIGFNKVANFNGTYTYRGSSIGSIADRYVEIAETLDPNELDNFEAGLAFDVGAIFPDGNGAYVNDYILEPGMPLLQKDATVSQSGSINELTFSYGANLKDKWYFGVTLGIPFLNYTREVDYVEQDVDDAVFAFNQLNYSEQLEISGGGANLKLGLIYRASQSIRIGAACAYADSATDMTENFVTNVGFSFTENGAVEESVSNSPDNEFTYFFSNSMEVYTEVLELSLVEKGFWLRR